MAFAAGLATKATAGVIIVGGIGGTGIYFTHEYYSNYISLYDSALINFLNVDGNDIIFSVKKGEGGNEDLSDNDINFSDSGATPVSVKVKVTANTSGTDTTFKESSSKHSKHNLDAIKALGKNGNGWTWECSFKFTAEGEGASGKTIKDDYKKRIWQNADLGLFGLLKKDLSSYTNAASNNNNKWTKEEIKQIKIGFVEKCGQKRVLSKNKELNKGKVEDKDIKVDDIAITFKVDGNNLTPTNEREFNHWFIRDKDKDKSYNTSSSS